jgi:hypothetical protein
MFKLPAPDPDRPFSVFSDGLTTPPDNKTDPYDHKPIQNGCRAADQIRILL